MALSIAPPSLLSFPQLMALLTPQAALTIPRATAWRKDGENCQEAAQGVPRPMFGPPRLSYNAIPVAWEVSSRAMPRQMSTLYVQMCHRRSKVSPLAGHTLKTARKRTGSSSDSKRRTSTSVTAPDPYLSFQQVPKCGQPLTSNPQRE